MCIDSDVSPSGGSEGRGGMAGDPTEHDLAISLSAGGGQKPQKIKGHKCWQAIVSPVIDSVYWSCFFLAAHLRETKVSESYLTLFEGVIVDSN